MTTAKFQKKIPDPVWVNNKTVHTVESVMQLEVPMTKPWQITISARNYQIQAEFDSEGNTTKISVVVGGKRTFYMIGYPNIKNERYREIGYYDAQSFKQLGDLQFFSPKKYIEFLKPIVDVIKKYNEDAKTSSSVKPILSAIIDTNSSAQEKPKHHFLK